MHCLRNACGKVSYQLFAISPSKNNYSLDELVKIPLEFIVRAENMVFPKLDIVYSLFVFKPIS